MYIRNRVTNSMNLGSSVCFHDHPDLAGLKIVFLVSFVLRSKLFNLKVLDNSCLTNLTKNNFVTFYNYDIMSCLLFTFEC